MCEMIKAGLASICAKIIHREPRTIEVYVASEYCCGEMIRDRHRSIYKHPLFHTDRIVYHGRLLNYPEAPEPTQTKILYPIILKTSHAHLLYVADYILYKGYVNQAAIFLGASAPKSAPPINMSKLSLEKVVDALFVNTEHMSNLKVYKRMQENLRWKR